MKTYYLIDTSTWKIIQTNSTMSDSDIDAKNQGYLFSNSPLKWYKSEETKFLPIIWSEAETKS
jgi:hypothetical protein